MIKRAIVTVALALLTPTPLWAQLGSGSTLGGGRATTRPPVVLGPGTRAATAPADVAPAVPLVSPKTFAPIPDDPIERPEFNDKTKPIAKNITSAMAMMIIDGPDGEIGLTADVIAAVKRGSAPFSADIIKKQAQVGKEMQTSFDEAVRAVQMRYPKLEPAQIEFSFGDKYTPHEGGSAGTCFSVMLLSEIEGFEIDPKCAVTGDITVNWKVRKIGGLPAKVRGAAADKCLCTGVPLENREQLYDMALFYGDASLRNIQVFSLETLQDAVALLRKDRSPQLTEAMKEFTALQPKLAGGRTTFNTPAITKVLENIVALAPNHESAKMMLEMTKGTFPRTLSLGFAVEQLGQTLAPYRLVLSGAVPANRQLISAALTQSSRKTLSQISQMCPPELAPLVMDMRGIVDTSENIAAGVAPPSAMKARHDAFAADIQKLDANKDFVEKIIRSGL